MKLTERQHRQRRANEAFDKFVANPFVKAVGGVDRVSFIAGYETCAETIANQLLQISIGKTPPPEELRYVPYVSIQRIADWIKSKKSARGPNDTD